MHIRLWERTRNGPERPAVFVRMGPETLLANLARGGIDGAIVQRNALPALWVDRFIEAFEKSGIPYILELDDDLLDVPADKDPQGRYAANAPRLKRLMRAATGVTVSTGQLEQKYKSINSQTRLVPNHLSRAVWALPELARKPDGMVRALYMGTVTHSVDLEMILPALEGVVREHPGFRLRLVGVTAQDLPGWVERIDIPPGCKNYPDFVRWLARQREHVDFALAPLVDTPFNACKSDLKILEQGALGLPVLASDTGPYRALASVPGVTLVRNTDHAWKTAVKKRILHPETRRQDGAALRAWVFENRSLEPTLDAYDGMLAEVFGWEKGESREINVPECADRRVGQ